MNIKAWSYLVAAVVAEIAGVTGMKLLSGQSSWPGLMLMYVMIGLSFYLLATAMKYLPMAVTYATWETIGLVSVTCISFFFFCEDIGPLKLVAMALLLIGVVLVNTGAPELKDNKSCNH